MKSNIKQLYDASRKPARRIIGLMSGTSLDGLDVALCLVRGAGLKTRVNVTHFATVPYDERFKAEIRRVFAKKEIDFQHLTLLNALVAERHAAIVTDCLRQWGVRPEEVDALASHGQTVFHAPRIFHGLPDYPNATLQIGDGDHIARRTGIVTLSDFRQKHVAAGGEGAPLALYGDYFLFSKKGEDRFLLNIGGIANFTYLPADLDQSKVFATDTGPGNTLSDAFAQQLFDVSYDQDGLLALAGTADEGLLADLKKEAFFAAPFPKTIGPELFSRAWVEQALERLPKGAPARNPYNLMATIARLSADTIADALLRVEAIHGKKTALYLSGGGAHNPAITGRLRERLPRLRMEAMAATGVHGDAKEAVLFAILANETLAGSASNTAALGGIPWVSMGKISLPD